MAKIGTLTLTGASGNKYQFNVYPFNTEFKAIPVVYYISKRTQKAEGSGSHSKIYIGETNDLSERFDGHHKASCFKRNNANSISIHQEANEAKRLKVERDLIDAYEPPCND